MLRNDPELIRAHTPACLRELAQWVCWRVEERSGKPTKVPYVSGTSRRASSTAPADWRTFDDAMSSFMAKASFLGVGFVFAPDALFCGVDLDDCRDPDGGALQPWAQKIVADLSSYTEISPSGTGVKIFLRGHKPGRRCRKAYESGEVEMYDRDRFFTVTGNHLAGTPDTVEDRQSAIELLYAQVFGAAGADEARNKASASPDASPIILSDDEIIRLITTKGKNRDKFSALWNGLWNDYYNTPSNADSGLIYKLAYFTKDQAQIDRIFRRSGLYRPKWDEMHGDCTYGERTISKALINVTDQYIQRTRSGKKPAPCPEEIEALISSGDIAKIFDHVAAFASLDKAAFGKLKARLKEKFGKSINLTDFVAAVRDARRRMPGSSSHASSTLPPIMTSGRQLRDTVTDGINALIAANEPPVLFSRRGSVAVLQRSESPEREEVYIQSFSAADTPAMKDHLSRAADFFKAGAEDREVPCSPPYDVAAVILSRPDQPFPPLEGVTQSPVIRADGSILVTPGYDPVSRLYYQPDSKLLLPDIPATPEPTDLCASVKLLGELVCDFPFTEDAGRVNFFALLLSTVMRPLIDGCVPLALIDAPRQGTGKGLLASIVGMIANGGETAVMISPKAGNEEEWRKRITSTLMGGPSVVLLDNIVDPLDSASLAAMLTAREWEDRRLGVSENVRLPVRAVWFGTGNNIQAQGDMPRRCYHIRIDSNLAQPWRRDGFRHPNLREWIMQNRGKLLASLLILARAWCAAGRPAWSGTPLGSFESWSRSIGGALEHAELSGFLGNAQRLYQEADEDTQQWCAFMDAWMKRFGSAPVKAKELCDEIKKRPWSDTPTDMAASLPSDLVTALDKGAGNLARRLGIALSNRRDVIYGAYRLTSAGVDSHDKIAMWKLTSATKDHAECRDYAEYSDSFAGSAGFQNQDPARPRKTPHNSASAQTVYKLPDTTEDPKKYPS